MAKKSIQIKTNFSFKKLSRNIEEVLEDFAFEEAKGYAAEARKPIAEGTLSPLTQNTISKREGGVSDYKGHSPTRTPGETRPLFYTGDLHNSIKAVKGAGVMLNEYGLEHNDGI